MESTIAAFLIMAVLIPMLIVGYEYLKEKEDEH
jgi:NADH:ubiquinone oxidoreductase subunit 3 (subunit A)